MSKAWYLGLEIPVKQWITLSTEIPSLHFYISYTSFKDLFWSVGLKESYFVIKFTIYAEWNLLPQLFEQVHLQQKGCPVSFYVYHVF